MPSAPLETTSTEPASTETSPARQTVSPMLGVASAERKYAVGVDYGTNSCRAVLVDTADGAEIAASVYNYLGGEAGVYVDEEDPNVARQDPLEYRTGFLHTVTAIVQNSRVEPHQVVGIGIDTTGSSPMPTDSDGTPLGMLEQWRGNLDAMCWLWKDHTSFAEAREITELAERRGEPYLAKCGGTYSSEWFWSKILRCARANPAVFDAAWGWIECADMIPALITGTLKEPMRSVTAAGHKAMWSAEWGGLPSENFLRELDPRLADLRGRLYEEAVPSDRLAGELTQEFADQIGLRAGIPVAVGSFDAHMGAVGSGIGPGTLVKIIGTSTCDIMVGAPGQAVPDIPGVCGVVPGSVLPGSVGIEMGQSAVGDIFNWFVNHLAPPDAFGSRDLLHAVSARVQANSSGTPLGESEMEATLRQIELAGDAIPYSRSEPSPHEILTLEAERLKPGESGLLALDWNNGNRTILVDPLLTGLLMGQTLHTTAAETFRALVEATAFGAKRIIERVEEYGVPVQEVVNCGGIAEKSPMTMQIYADVIGKPMRVSRSSQTPALGAAVFACVVGGAYDDVKAAQRRMTGVKPVVYEPIPENAATYRRLYGLYLQLHDAFGTREGMTDLGNVMKDLIAIRTEVRARD